MKHVEFQHKIKVNPRPIIVDIWAPWCNPCKAMEPAFRQVSTKYVGKVDVLKINADESSDVLKSIGVMSIPTVIAFANGQEIVRRTGMQSENMLDVIFDAALNRRKPVVMPLAPAARIFRVFIGLGLVVIGWFVVRSVILIGLGGIFLFSAVYDRCPIYRAVVSKIKALLQSTKEKKQPS
jgi:thioredoxin